MKPFSVDINLDDEETVNAWIATHNTNKGRIVANRLGLKGKGSSDLATALSNYAWNKYTAIGLRKRGEIQTAISYESICDRIYKQDIAPVCECW